jgi:hypothetical protein
LKGIKKIGLGRWKLIWSQYQENFHQKRKPMDLKDRWRVLKEKSTKEVEHRKAEKEKK